MQAAKRLNCIVWIVAVLTLASASPKRHASVAALASANAQIIKKASCRQKNLHVTGVQQVLSTAASNIGCTRRKGYKTNAYQNVEWFRSPMDVPTIGHQ